MSRPFIHQTIERLIARCVEEGDCLLWQGGCDGHGRPQCRHGGKTCYVRRVMRELVDGKPVPAGRVVPACCGHRLCVSPKCSEVGTDKRRAQLAAQRGAYSSAAKTARMVATLDARIKAEQVATADREMALKVSPINPTNTGI